MFIPQQPQTSTAASRPQISAGLANVIFTAALLFLTFAAVICVLIGVYHTLIVLISKGLPLLTTFVIPSLAIVLAIGVHTFHQPAHNLLCLIGVFFITVLLYVRVGAEFLGFLFLIVYVGAIAILFLFVIMLLNLKKEQKISPWAPGLNKKTVMRLLMATTVLGMDDLVSTELSCFFLTSDSISLSTENNSIKAVSRTYHETALIELFSVDKEIESEVRK